MIQYLSPIVVRPPIPDADMTPFERLVLTHLFQSEPQGDGLYFFSATGAQHEIGLPVDTVRAALAASVGDGAIVATYARDRLAEIGDGDTVLRLDLGQAFWRFIFQDIVRRSPTLHEVTVVMSFTCTEMRPDGFGGMAALITADAVKAKSTDDLLTELRNETAYGPVGGPPGSGVHVLLRLAEADVGAEIVQLLAEDDTLTTTAADAVTGDDIRAGCLFVVERVDFSEERESARYKAALAAIREAEQRLASGG
jgi:hypothetical protein